MSVLEKLTEGIVNRDLQKEGTALLNKWEATGLLEGLDSEEKKSSMSRLLENQARQLLKEASSMSVGDVEGFAAVAFPIVRRVFGGLIANDLVSVQPMSLPSGLIFFLDFQHTGAKLGTEANDSLYGGQKVALEITGGVDLSGEGLEEGFYGLNNGYSSPTGSVNDATIAVVASGSVGTNGGTGTAGVMALGTSALLINELRKAVRFDPDLEGESVVVYKVATSLLTDGNSVLNPNNLPAISTGVGGDNIFGGSRLCRRLTHFSGSDKVHVNLVVQITGTAVGASGVSALQTHSAYSAADLHFPIIDNFAGSATAGTADGIGVVAGATTWGLENTANIPEIDIKVDSVSVTALTKKLKAKWTPELGQDLNAYHNLDAEVELTSILSEQIALEIDREILADLVADATAGTYYWSRSPGLFVNRTTGAEIGASALAPDFTGTVSEWYETLAETINDVSAQIHRKTLRGGANFIVVSPEVATILEFTAGFRASVAAGDDRGTVGTVKVGSMSKKWDVYVDPYFPRNLVLVGRKGSSFLESGYVYAPYVPLQVTPTIFGIEDFVPRKGVMTRYAKKMVRPDMYGLVIVRGLLGESGG